MRWWTTRSTWSCAPLATVLGLTLKVTVGRGRGHRDGRGLRRAAACAGAASAYKLAFAVSAPVDCDPLAPCCPTSRRKRCRRWRWSKTSSASRRCRSSTVLGLAERLTVGGSGRGHRDRHGLRRAAAGARAGQPIGCVRLECARRLRTARRLSTRPGAGGGAGGGIGGRPGQGGGTAAGDRARARREAHRRRRAALPKPSLDWVALPPVPVQVSV